MPKAPHTRLTLHAVAGQLERVVRPHSWVRHGGFEFRHSRSQVGLGRAAMSFRACSGHVRNNTACDHEKTKEDDLTKLVFCCEAQ